MLGAEEEDRGGRDRRRKQRILRKGRNAGKGKGGTNRRRWLFSTRKLVPRGP